MDEKKELDSAIDSIKYKPTNTYDFKKTVKVELNPTFIQGLENILVFYMTNVYDNPVKIPYLFEAFEALISGNKDKIKDESILDFSPVESHMFIIFSLQQLLKYEAEKQGLVVERKEDESFTEKEIKDALSNMINNADDKVKTNLLNILKESRKRKSSYFSNYKRI